MRRSRAIRRLVGLGALAMLVYVVGFFGYGFTIGAAEYLAAQPRAIGCETPGSRFGWPYEAVNYVPASDELANIHPDASTCAGRAATAGTDVMSPDGIHLAAWYIPRAPRETSAGGAATLASGPTVVIVDGGKSNASGMLEYAAPLHGAYDLLLVDLRNSGRSGTTESTGGLREQNDLRAMIDWLERTKGPAWIAVLGNSNGAAAALAEARTDNRVRALILDSMHASLEWQIGNVIETEKHLPAWPGAWGLIAGTEARLARRCRRSTRSGPSSRFAIDRCS